MKEIFAKAFRELDVSYVKEISVDCRLIEKCHYQIERGIYVAMVDILDLCPDETIIKGRYIIHDVRQNVSDVDMILYGIFCGYVEVDENSIQFYIPCSEMKNAEPSKEQRIRELESEIFEIQHSAEYVLRDEAGDDTLWYRIESMYDEIEMLKNS